MFGMLFVFECEWIRLVNRVVSVKNHYRNFVWHTHIFLSHSMFSIRMHVAMQQIIGMYNDFKMVTNWIHHSVNVPVWIRIFVILCNFQFQFSKFANGTSVLFKTNSSIFCYREFSQLNLVESEWFACHVHSTFESQLPHPFWNNQRRNNIFDRKIKHIIQQQLLRSYDHTWKRLERV